MGHFFRSLVQWLTIALFACLPIYLPYLPVLIISGFVVFGLIAYGLSNPELAIRRAFLWGSLTVVSAFMLNEVPIEQITEAGRQMSLPEPIVNLALSVLTIVVKSAASPWILVPLALLLILELARMGFEYLRSRTSKGLSVGAARPYGDIIVEKTTAHRVTLEHTCTVTNDTDNRIQITAGFLKCWLTLRAVKVEIYRYGKEAAPETPIQIEPNTAADLDVVWRTVPSSYAYLFTTMKKWHISRFISIPGRLQLYGDNVLQNVRAVLAFKIK
ncbi:hypothetical protein [Sinorhizobium meliloti]|uniref:hypothetical protein n=1 Tax=Rhizobium meliloti TaxID=382 RepID=UPI000FDBF16B|nr:hypothetical protein [Sinorhizobium meliloti]RVK16939.1 hypothetical protein CN164_03235 [Sinorhizobium meliloti]